MQIEKNLVAEPLQSSPENRDDDVDSETSDFLVVPSNLSAKKCKKLTQQFRNQLLKFLSHECEIQFFMTWVFAARSFRERELMAAQSVFKSHPVDA